MFILMGKKIITILCLIFLRNWPYALLLQKTDIVIPVFLEKYCKFRNFHKGFIFRETLHLRSFMKIKSS